MPHFFYSDASDQAVDGDHASCTMQPSTSAAVVASVLPFLIRLLTRFGRAEQSTHSSEMIMKMKASGFLPQCRWQVVLALLVSSRGIVGAVRVISPSFRLIPLTFGSSQSFQCNQDIADQIAITVDDCLQQSTLCLMTSIFGAGPECGVNLDGTSRVDSVLAMGDSVLIPQGFLDVAGSTITSDTVEAECIKPTLESNACLQLVQERFDTFVGLNYVSLASAEYPPQEDTPPPVQLPLTERPTQAPTQPPTTAPTAAPTRAPIPAPTRAPVVAPTTESPTAAPMADLVEVVPTDAPTKSPTASPITMESPSASPITDAPTQSQTAQSPPTALENLPTTQVPTTTDERGSEPETNVPEEAEPTNNPDIPVTTGNNDKSPNSDTEGEDDNQTLIIGVATGSAVAVLLLLCIVLVVCKRRLNKSLDFPSPPNTVDDDSSIPKNIDIEMGRDDTENTSESTLHQEEMGWQPSPPPPPPPVESNDSNSFRVEHAPSPSSIRRQRKQQRQEQDNESVPSMDEIMSTGSSSLAYTLESGGSSSFYSETEGAGTTTDFDGYTTGDSIASSDLLDSNTMRSLAQDWPSDNDDGARSMVSSSNSSIDSEDSDTANQNRSYGEWLARSTRLVPAAQEAAARVAPPETSQADF